MFNINFMPTRCDNLELLTVSVSKDTITINGIAYDFSPLKDGDTLPRQAFSDSGYIIGGVSRVGKDINISILMPYRYGAPESVTFPEPVFVKAGVVKVPTDVMEVTE